MEMRIEDLVLGGDLLSVLFAVGHFVVRRQLKIRNYE